MSEASMTEAEVKLGDEKIRAEITKLFAETARLNAETTKIREADFGHVKMQTLVAPFLAAAGVIGATAAVVKIFFS